MAIKNYYLILGVPREETQAGIRARYRDLVKRLHPDVAGEASTSAFQAIEEAYEVLSDPEHRRRYNRDLRIQEGEPSPSRPATRPRAGASGERPVAGGVPEPVSLNHFQTVRPSFEALFDRFLRNFTGAGVPKSEHLEPMDFEVILAPEEAARGGSIPIGIPVFRACMACRGTGRNWMFYCPRCGGRGLAAEERRIEVRIPPIHRSPAVFEVPLRGLGIRNLFLRLHIFVSDADRA